MLIPAIVKKEEVIINVQKQLFTESSMYWSGYIATDGDCSNMCEVRENRYNYAIINNDDHVIGYFAYNVSYYDDCAYGIQFIAFTNNANDKAIIAKDLRTLFKDISRFHRVEFRCVSGNPAEKRYDKLEKYFKNHKLNKIIFHDTFKDKYGKYHDDYIYEFIKEEEK